MNTAMLTRVRKLFSCAERKINRHNQRAWVRSVRRLGPAWLLAAPIARPGTPLVSPCVSPTSTRADIAPTRHTASPTR
jgi:hypothetical protein